MVKIRLIFVKQFASRRKVSHKQVFFRNEIDQKIIISTVLLLWNKMVQSSLKWLLGSSRRDKRLAWLSQGQLQTRLRFWSKLEIKRIHNALLCGAFCDINKSLTKLVSNYTLSVIQDLFSWYCELLLVPKWWKCQFSQLIYNSEVISRVPNQYPKWSFSYSNHPSSFKTY